MRSGIKEACRLAIPGLCQVYGLPQPAEVILDDEGWVNPCFFVDDRFVFRFNARDPELPKFQREELAYGLLGRHGLPVPRVLRLDTGKRHVPWDVLVTERLQGAAIERSWKTFEPVLQQTLAREAGVLLARIHRIPLEGGFGELVDPPQTRQARWSACFHRRCEERLDEVLRHGVFDAAEVARFRRVLEGHEALLDTVSEPALVHGDYHLGNLLSDGGRVTGVLDFEWCFAGDPEFDLVNLHNVEEFSPGGREPLEQGYHELLEPSPELGRKLPLYRLSENLALCVVAELHFSREEAREFRETTLGRLERMEAG